MDISTLAFGEGVSSVPVLAALGSDWQDWWLLPVAAVIAGVLGACYVILIRLQVRRRTELLKKEFTRRRLLEEQLNRSQKLKAQGVFHDFNNLFQVIMGCGELALADIPQESGSHAFVQQIINAAEKARMLVKQLTGLGYRNVTSLKRLDIDEVLATQVPLLRHVVGESINMQFSAVGEGKFIYGAAEQIAQLLRDLTENSRDAMPNGGNVVITTRRVRLADEEAEQGSRDYVQLTFKDNGCGIPEKDIQNIFEPFFTAGKGRNTAGLGLSTVSSIVEGHGGFIEVHTKLGEGTTFAIYFPATPDLSKTAPPERPPAKLSRGGSETILVADDEEDVCMIAEKTLTAAGYRVLVARDGDQAVSMLEQHANDIDLVLLDVVMPGKTGRTVFDCLQEIRSDLPALFSSGCSHEQLQESYGIDIPREALVQKPYHAEELLEEIRRLLDDKRASSGAAGDALAQGSPNHA